MSRNIIYLFVSTIIMSSGCQEIKRHQGARKLSVGQYEIDFSKMSMTLAASDSIALIGLKLHLFRDGSFKSSNSPVLFGDTIGTWEIEGIGENIHVNLNFSNGPRIQTSICCIDEKYLTISPYLIKSEQKKRVGAIYLKKNIKHLNCFP
jgi:hypothetical protein